MKIQVIDELDQNFDLSFQSQISKEYEEVFIEAEKVYSFLKKIVDKREIEPKKNLPLAAILALYGRFLLTFKELIVLLKLGFDTDANLFLRMLIEEMFSLMHIYYYPDEANKFFVKDKFEELSHFEVEDNFPGLFAKSRDDLLKIQSKIISDIYEKMDLKMPKGQDIVEIKKSTEFKELRKKFPSHWAGDWASVVDKLDKKEKPSKPSNSYKMIYRTFYKSTSTITHPSLFFHKKYFKGEQDEITIQLSTSSRFIIWNLSPAYGSIKKIMRVINEITPRDNMREFHRIISRAEKINMIKYRSLSANQE
jgi:hypothetical protein